MSVRLCLFAREPAPGAVKTRLAEEIGPEAALKLYTSFLADLAAALPCRDWEAVVARAGVDEGRLMSLFPAPWRLEPQGEGDLGQRLARAFGCGREAGAEATVVAGSDAPTMRALDVARAFELLGTRAEVVLAPAPDGGFSLVGARATVDERRLVAGVRWSSPNALEDTRRAAERERLSVALLPELPDVDVAADLARLRSALANDASLAPVTRRALAEVDAGAVLR